MEYLTVNDVAERLHVTPFTVRRWLTAGFLVGIPISDRVEWRIAETALQRFLDARQRGGVQERDRLVREA
jgi:excisionase family DNA binding protein